MKPRFITLEGGEGAGKSTQLKLLAKSLAAAKIKTVTTREPGGSKGGEAIRTLLVSGAVDAWQPETESLLFLSARYDHVEAFIKPALKKGAWVLCDRFHDSTVVYQGIGKGVSVAWLAKLYKSLFGSFAPDMTLLLDIDPKRGLKRADTRGNKKESRFERMGLAYHQKIRKGFLSLAKAHGKRIAIIDASASPQAVHQAIIRSLNERFGLKLKPAKAE